MQPLRAMMKNDGVHLVRRDEATGEHVTIEPLTAAEAITLATSLLVIAEALRKITQPPT